MIARRWIGRCSFFVAVWIVAPVWGSATIEDGVLTFHVESGAETYSASIGTDILAIIKTGAGKMTVTGSNPDFMGKTVTVKGGLLEMMAKDSLGSGNTVTVESGAQLVLSMTVPSGEEMLCPGGYNDLVIAGTGPDGNGAVYKNTTTTAANAAAFFGNIRLSGDAAIYVYDKNGVASGFGRTVDMGGHELVIKGSGSMFCGYGYQRQANMNIWKNGTLVLDGPQVMFEGNPVFDGGSTNKVVMRKTVRHKFYDFAPQIAWTLEVENYMVLEASRSWKDGQWDVTANTWAGPVIVKAANSTLDVVGSSYSAYASSPQSLTFAGPITVTNGSKGVVVYKAGPYALLRLGGSFTGSGLDVQAGQTVRAINDGVFPASVDAKNAGGVFEVQPGVDFCSDVGAAVLLGSVTTSVNRWSAGKAAIYTDSDTTFIKPITMHSYKVGLKHTGSGTLTFTDNLTADDSGVRGIWWLNDADNRTVFAGNKTDIALMNVTAGTVEVAEGGRVFMSAGSGSGFEIGGSGTAAKAELRISGGCLDMDLPSAGQPTGYILLGDDGAKPAKLTVTGGALTNRLYGASRSASDKAAVSQTGGEIYNYSTSNTGNKYYTPVLAARGKGFFGLHGGTYRVNGNDVIAGETNSHAVFRQTGGKIATDTSSYFMNLSRGGVGEFTMTGGELVNDNSAGYLRLGDSTASGMGGSATMTLCGTGNPLVRIAGWLNLSARTDGFTSTLNLNAGTLECCRVYVSNKAAREGTSGAFVNFNGGRMRSSASTANLFGDNVTRPPTAITIYPEGATFDTPTGYKNYFSKAEKGIDEVMVVRSATGRGVKRIRLPEDMPRTGYAGILPVRISGGDGSCATAAMAYDPATGTVGDELIVTCPGVDYTEPPTVTVFGPDWTTEYACVVELTETEQTPGVIYKTGEGMLGFNCISNSFAGTVVVSNGTFYVPQASEIDPRIQIRCAGGMFEYDWKSRTVAEIGGFGVIKGSPNDNSAHNLTVTDGLRFNAADALAGHTLTMEDGADQSVSDRIILGESAVIWIENMELLADQDQGYSYALLRTSFPLNRLPDLAIELPEGWFIRLSDDSRTLSLYQSKGTVMLIR